MITDTALVEKREELKRKLAAGEYRTLIDVLLDGTGRLVQKLTRNPKPMPYWYSAALIVLTALAIGLLTPILLGDFIDEYALTTFPTAGFLFIGLIIFKIQTGFTHIHLRDHIVDAIESAEDLIDLQNWLAVASNKKASTLFALAFGVAFGLLTAILDSTVRGRFVGVGGTFTTFIVTILLGMGSYYVLLFFTLPLRLSRYRFKLYATDPSSSEVISHLSSMLTSFVYLTAALIAVLMLLFAASRLLISTFIFLILVAWGALATVFVTIQYALAKIITRAKWKTLNEVQAKVEKLQAAENLAEKETMDAINRLMDFHDRIKATRNSALDLRAGLNFLNSLLLPLLAFLLANLDKVLALFQ